MYKIFANKFSKTFCLSAAAISSAVASTVLMITSAHATPSSTVVATADCSRYNGFSASGVKKTPYVNLALKDSDTNADVTYYFSVNFSDGSSSPYLSWMDMGNVTTPTIALPDGNVMPVSVTMYDISKDKTITGVPQHLSSDPVNTISAESATNCGGIVNAPVVKQAQIEGTDNDIFTAADGHVLDFDEKYTDGTYGYLLGRDDNGNPQVEVGAMDNNSWIKSPNGLVDTQLLETFTDNGQAPTREVITSKTLVNKVPVVSKVSTTTNPSVAVEIITQKTFWPKGTMYDGKKLNSNRNFTNAELAAVARVDDDNKMTYAEYKKFNSSFAHTFGTISVNEIKTAGSFERAVANKYHVNVSANVVSVKSGSAFSKAWILDTAHGATVSRPVGPKFNLALTDMDAIVMPKPVTTVKNVTTYKNVSTTQKVTTQVENSAPAVSWDTENKPM